MPYWQRSYAQKPNLRDSAMSPPVGLRGPARENRKQLYLLLAA